ncbi:hypothetical protein MMEU_4715 [Mycobacterium marinum str. Europe]|nr:hypothetical protein MMEU_4715 [Mycobacterium marinum str. Europe]
MPPIRAHSAGPTGPLPRRHHTFGTSIGTLATMIGAMFVKSPLRTTDDIY